jgi:hypothetical protein
MMKGTQQDAGIRTGYWQKKLSDMLISELPNNKMK